MGLTSNGCAKKREYSAPQSSPHPINTRTSEEYWTCNMGVMRQSIPKPPIPPPGQTPGHLTFWKNFGQIPRYIASLDGQMPRRLGLQRASNPCMRLILMKNNHPTNNICKQRRSPKEEKLMNIDLRGHSWHAAFCHALRS